MRLRIASLLFALLLVTACAGRQPEPPPSPTAAAAATHAADTATPAAAEPPLPTATLPPTATIRPTATTRPTATPEPPTPTPVRPTATATAAAPRSTVPVIIAEPEPEASVEVEGTLQVAGTGPRDSDAISITLKAAGLLLAETSAAPDSNGQWSATLTVPGNVTGDALLRASAGGQTAEQPVQVVRTVTAPPFITLVHPDNTWHAVSGRALIFQGRVQRPPEGLVTIAVRYDECRETAAEHSFDIGAGGRYWGYLVIPEEVTGPACAVASFGEPGDDAWRSATALVDVVPPDDEAAHGLFLANFPDVDVPAGEPVAVYGSAYNAPNRQVFASLEIGDRTVAEGTAIADSFGYWEIDLTLPETTPAGSAGRFVATVNYPGAAETMSVPFVVVAP